MIEDIDYFLFRENLIFTVCNGDQYKLPTIISLSKGGPKNPGRYPISNGKKSELGKYLSYWDGDSWSRPVASSEAPEVACNLSRLKSREFYWWFEPWWDCEPCARG